MSGRPVILISGSSSGIGRACAVEAARQGYDVILHGRGHSERLTESCRLVNQAGGHAIEITGDFLSFQESDFKTFVDSAFELASGRLEGWVNNAGCDVLTGDARNRSFAEKLEMVWQVDVRATLMLTRLAGECWQNHVSHEASRAVVNIGWDQATTGLPGDSGQMFGASKGAIMAMTAALAKTYAPVVRVNCVAPGWIRTAWGNQTDPEWDQWVAAQTLADRWGTPEDIAAGVLFLLSPASRYINGQVLNINGGLRTTTAELEQRLR